VDLGFLFFAREELPISESALPSLFRRCSQLRDAALAIVMEPTDNTLQIGCLGNLNAELTFHGQSAHSARPWQGENALHKAIGGLQALASVEPNPVDIGGLTYTEVLSLTKIAGGIAQNVIPDRVTCHVNYRYAPNRTPAEAEQRLLALKPESAELTVVGNSPPARAAVDNPLVGALRRLGDLPVEPKQAWTPVAEFSAEGLDAINFGPGMSRYAHQRDEQVRVADIVRAFELLQRFACEGACS
jgi:succinyl-diaminopimelate desuccinylase